MRKHRIDAFPGLRFVETAGGWFLCDHALPCARAQEFRSLAAIAERVRVGLLDGNSPMLLGVKEPGGGLPPVAIAVPLSHEDVAAWRAGDRSIAGDVREMMEDEYAAFMAQVTSGKLN